MPVQEPMSSEDLLHDLLLMAVFVGTVEELSSALRCPLLLKHVALARFGEFQKRQAELERQEAIRQAELEAIRQAELQRQEARRQAELQRQEARRQAELQRQEARRQAELEQQEARRQAELEQQEAMRQAQQKEQDILDAVEATSNAMWCLHMILAGQPLLHDQLDVSPQAQELLLGLFGWTLSFSRAMHSGRDSLEAWFKAAGIDTFALKDKYQCASQEADAFKMIDARVSPTDFVGVHRVECVYSIAQVEVSDEFEDPDNQRQGASPAETPTVQRETCVLMNVPVLDRVVDKVDFVLCPVELNGEPVTLPLVKAQLYSKMPKAVPGRRQVHRMPFFLTPPRIQLLLQLAECMGLQAPGASLTGIHGTGKSVFLKALAAILPAGYPCDMLHVGKAKSLFEQPQLAWELLAQGSGHVVDSRAKGEAVVREMEEVVHDLKRNQEIVREQWRKGAADEARGATILTLFADLKHCDTQESLHLKFLKHVLQNTERATYNCAFGRVVILDEVNELLRELAKSDQPKPSPAGTQLGDQLSSKVEQKPPPALHAAITSPEYVRTWESWLPWTFDTGMRSFRILASSPDGAREKRGDRDYEVFYELRPTRFDHLAAILYAAPEFVQPDHGLDREYTQGPAALVRAKEACQTLCGNLRYTAKYFKSFTAEMRHAIARSAPDCRLAPNVVRDMHASCLKRTRDSYSHALSERLIKTHDDPNIMMAAGPAEEKQTIVQHGPQSVSSSLFALMAKNASMIVRTDARGSNSECDVLGSVSVAALREFLAKRNRIARDDPGDRAAAGIFLKEWDSKCDGAALEDLVQTRLALSALSARAWRLDQLHRVDQVKVSPGGQSAERPRTLLDLCEVHKHWEPDQTAYAAADINLADALHQSPAWWFPANKYAGRTKESVWQIRQSATNAPSKVDADVEHSIKACLQNGGILLIRTADQFPGVDFIQLRVPPTAESCSVTFVKVTKSSLRQHGKNRKCDVPGALKDIAAVTVPTCTVARHEDGTWWRTSKAANSLKAEWKASANSSILNFWLRQLGCPMRVQAFPYVPSAGHLTLKLVAAADSDCMPTTLKDRPWDVSLLYVSTSDDLLEQPSEYESLHADFVYGIFKPDFNDALESWAHVPEVPLGRAAGSAQSAASEGGQ